MKKSLKDIPLQEITLRRYESPSGQQREETIRKFLLSVGLLQPGESRDVIVNIFSILLQEGRTKPLSLDFFLQRLTNKPGASPPNVRRQLRRLRELKLCEKLPTGEYRACESVSAVVDSFIVPFVINQSAERLKEYSNSLD